MYGDTARNSNTMYTVLLLHASPEHMHRSLFNHILCVGHVETSIWAQFAWKLYYFVFNAFFLRYFTVSSIGARCGVREKQPTKRAILPYLHGRAILWHLQGRVILRHLHGRAILHAWESDHTCMESDLTCMGERVLSHLRLIGGLEVAAVVGAPVQGEV